MTAMDGGNAGFAGAKTCPIVTLIAKPPEGQRIYDVIQRCLNPIFPEMGNNLMDKSTSFS
ncbi:MAG TPA: hypothetical protein EYG42_08695 [Porticoccaceae bacterium]|nr:hypothetical protein [Porticoccaceae bacterium]